MPNQRSADNTQTSISLPKVLLAFAQKKSDDMGLENVSAYIRILLKREQLGGDEDITHLLKQAEQKAMLESGRASARDPHVAKSRR